MLAGGSERSYFAFGVKSHLKVLFWNNEPSHEICALPSMGSA